MAIKNLVPRNHKEGKLGVESKKWKEVHAETGSFERIEGTFSLSTGSITGESGSFGVLRVDGDTKLSGSVHIGVSSSVDTTYLYIDSLLSSSLIPAGSGSFDLGDTQHPWRDLYILTESVKFVKKKDDGTGFEIAETFSKSDITALKEGKTLKALSPGKITPDVVAGGITAEDGTFTGEVTAKGFRGSITGSHTSSLIFGSVAADPTDSDFVKITSHQVSMYSGSDFWKLSMEDGDPNSAINGTNIVFEWGDDPKMISPFSPDNLVFRFNTWYTGSNLEDRVKDVMLLTSAGRVGIGPSLDISRMNDEAGNWPPASLYVTGSISSSGDIQGSSITSLDTITTQKVIATQKIAIGKSEIGTDELTIDGNASSSGYFKGTKFITTQGQIYEQTSAEERLWIDGTNTSTDIFTDKLNVKGDISASGDITASNINVIGTIRAITGSFLHTVSQQSNITNYSASVFSGSVLISGSTPGYPATLTVDGNISASGYVSASTIYADEMYLASSSLWIGGKRLTSEDIGNMKEGRTLRADRHTLTYRVRDYVQEDNFMHLGSSDRIYFNVGGKTIFDLDTGNNTIFLGKESGLGNIHPTVSASGDLWVSGSGTVVGNLLVRGDATINGNLTFGNEDTDSVSFGGDISSSLIPDSNLTYNLGSLSKRWNGLNIGIINATGTISSSGTVTGHHLYAGDEGISSLASGGYVYAGYNGKFIWQGDTNTYLQHSDDEIQIWAGGQEFIKINEGWDSGGYYNDGENHDYILSKEKHIFGKDVQVDQNIIIQGNTWSQSLVVTGSSIFDDITVGNITSSVGQTYSWDHSNGKGTRLISDTDGTLKLQSTYIGAYNSPIPNTLLSATGSTFGKTRVGIGTEVNPGSKEGLTVQGSISSSGDLYIGGGDIRQGDGTKRLTFGDTNKFVGHLEATDTVQGGYSQMGDCGWSAYAAFGNKLIFGKQDYALLHHTTGETYLNASTGSSIKFRMGNTGPDGYGEVMKMTETKFESYVPIEAVSVEATSITASALSSGNISASGDVNIGGNLNVTGTIGGNNIQGGAFETDGLGDIMPTSEIIFTDIYYEVDANNDLMPRL